MPKEAIINTLGYIYRYINSLYYKAILLNSSSSVNLVIQYLIKKLSIVIVELNIN